jgi:hypothetical protein
MTRISLLSLFLVAALLGCSESEHDRSERLIRERQARAQSRANESGTPQVSDVATTSEPKAQEQAAPEPEPEPEKPAEPETETHYFFTSTTEKNPVECTEDGDITPCGVHWKNCEGDREYTCQIGVKSWSKAVVVSH